MNCPYCQEEIKDESIKCRYCGEFLDLEKVLDEKDKKIPVHEKLLTFIGMSIGSIGFTYLVIYMMFEEPIFTPPYSELGFGDIMSETKDLTGLGWVIYVGINLLILYLFFRKDLKKIVS